MGKLVQFDKRGRAKREKPATEGEAQIFLFTGVRYERGDAPAPGKPAGTAARKRRRG